MQATTQFLCSPIIPSSHHPLFFPFLNPLSRLPSPTWVAQFPSKTPPKCLRAISPLHSVATQEIVETDEGELEFVEVGYISGVHGVRGEVSIKPSTDFPELRFSKPGKRWLRQLGQESVQEVELIGGRGNPGQKTWLLRFGGVDTVEQARQLVGSTLLVREDDKPDMEEGEFYINDLLGMRVILKETAECLGTVVDVYNNGAQDLLRVSVSSEYVLNVTKKTKAETGVSSHLVWVPFVKAIVPDVDMDKREMQITPPEGLLVLNFRVDDRSKNERRQIEWKERKKVQRRLIAAKKNLVEMEQKHVFDGLRYGEKSQRSLLANEILGINSKLLRRALENMEIPSKRLSITDIIGAGRSRILKVPRECLAPNASKQSFSSKFKLKEQGQHLISEGKMAVVLIVNDIEKGRDNSPDAVDSDGEENSLLSSLGESLSDDHTFIKTEVRASLPLILVCPGNEINSLKMLFSENDYFAFNPEKVWFLEEECLPVVNSSVEEHSRHKILMKSPWEVLQSPVGSGGLIGSLYSNNIQEHLSKLGVDYVEICTSGTDLAGNPLLLAFIDSRKADIGIQMFKDMKDSEERLNMIFSLRFMKQLIKLNDKLQFEAIPKTNAHVELVDKEWVDVVPSSPNSYEFRCSIYSSLNFCPLEKICLMKVTD
ncbi:hypothetical protein Tsubulata_010844 [Turnera subulata]|uniref:RimM N-terminal domain-containing protein n=1 Tax=Turnera subulata TaxID=218843 RepID=A0A9Q0GAB4_9ROSI|nr:hypothetical protein Tsubulata_010844 [Turnera subulata]